MSDTAALSVVIDPTSAVSGWTSIVNASNAGAAAVNTAVSGMGNTVTTNISILQKAATQTTAFGEAMKAASATINVVKGALDALGSTASFFNGFVQAGAQVDGFRAKFGGLIGDYGKANDALAQLRTFSTANPISFGDLAQSTLDLAKMTDALGATGGGMAGVIKLVEQIGSAAPENLNEATQAVGKFYLALQTGERIEMPARQLVQMHVANGDLLVDLDRLNQKGATSAQMWGELTKQLDLNAGNAARYASTYDGLVEMLGNAGNLAKQAFGEPLAISLKQPLADLTKLLVAADGPAAAFGKALGDDVRLFYGLWKNGDLSAYLKEEFDDGVAYLTGKAGQFGVWFGDEWKKHISDPFASANFGGALDKTFANAGQYIHAAFDDGVSSFRAGMAYATQELELGLESVFNKLLNVLPDWMSMGRLAHGTDTVKGYGEYKAQYSAHDTPYPTDIFKPTTDSADALAKSLLGLDSAAQAFRTSLPLLLNPLTANTGAAGFASSLSTAATSLTTAANSFTAKATGYYAAEDPQYMKDGVGLDRMGNPLQTLDAFRRGQAPYVTVSMDSSAYPYGTQLTSPQFPGVPFRTNDTGGAFQGMGTSRVDIARDNSAGAHATEVNGNITFNVGGATGSVNVDAMRDRAMGVTNFPLASPGNGSLQQYDALAQSIKNAQAQLAGFGLQVQKSDVAESQYSAAIADIDTLLKNNVISQGQANALQDKAQEKLAASTASYQAMAGAMGEAAAKQAQLNQSLAHQQAQVNLGVASPGQSLSFGAQKFAQDQGNQDQQLAKFSTDSLNTATNDVSSYFSAWASGSQQGQQSFKQFTSSLLHDLEALVVKMLIVWTVQKLIGFAGGGGGGFEGYSGGASSIFSTTSNIGTDGLGTSYGISGAAVGVGHGGAVIGGWTTGNRIVDPSVFYGAPRHHSGGMLGYDEVPFIGLRGERVLSRSETAAYNRGGGGATINMPITINSSGGNDADGKDPTSDPAFARNVQKRIRGVVREELIRANRYGGINNPR